MRLLGDVQSIAEENEVQLAGFGLARQPAVVLEVDSAVGYCFGMAPRGHVATGPS